MSEQWHDEAACRGRYDLMFDETRVSVAVALCARCPVYAECDSYATEYRPPAGVWAGMDAKTRRRLQRVR